MGVAQYFWRKSVRGPAPLTPGFVRAPLFWSTTNPDAVTARALIESDALKTSSNLALPNLAKLYSLNPIQGAAENNPHFRCKERFQPRREFLTNLRQNQGVGLFD
jgi:hypothetical protein